MNYLDPEYQEFLRRQMLGQAEPVMLDPSLVPPEQVAVGAVAPVAEIEPEPKPMTELEQIQARIGQASAQTQDAAKQYQDWLAGLGGRFRSDMEKQSRALEGASREARDMGLLHQSTGLNLALLGLKDAAQPYQQMAVQAAQIQGQAPQKQQQLFSDYLQKVAGLEGRGLESKMEMAGRLEQGARGELTKYQDRLSQEMRHAQSMLMAAKTAEEQRKWQEEMKRLEIASREAQSAADRSFRASEGALNRENQRMVAEMGAGARASNENEHAVQKLAKEIGPTPDLFASQIGEIASKVGGLDSPASDLPGVGRLEGFIPNRFASSKAIALRADLRALTNTLLKLQSGTGVSTAEREEAQQLHGLGEDIPEEQVYEGIRRAKALAASAVRSALAGYKPEVVELYRQRGGIMPDEILELGTSLGEKKMKLKKLKSRMAGAQ